MASDSRRKAGPSQPRKVPSDAPSERQREWAHDSETEAAPSLSATRGQTEPEPPRSFLVIRTADRASFLDLDDPGEWVIGRDREAQIVVVDRQLSRRHAKLTLASGVLTVEDLGSRNGTRVNGQTLQKGRARIDTGDVIEVGGCQLVVATRTGRVLATRSTSDESAGVVDIVIADPEMARLYASVRKVARMATTVLILGETGSGKDVLAQRLHLWSPRASAPLVRINCAGIPESLLESELFGYERGAFTGAERRKVGYFEAANGGTVFLDEIGELTQSAQLRLLHVLENRTVTRLGGTAPLPIDVRVICATHRDLQALVATARFRADLFYRISPFVVNVPPLRQRPTEIELLANVFARQFAEQNDAPPPTIAPEAMTMLMGYPWPGNVRELRNAIEHAFVMAEGSAIRREHFAVPIRAFGQKKPPSIKAARDSFLEDERKTIEAALTAEGGNQTRAAGRLGMSRRTLVHKLAGYRRKQVPEDGGGSGSP